MKITLLALSLATGGCMLPADAQMPQLLSVAVVQPEDATDVYAPEPKNGKDVPGANGSESENAGSVGKVSASDPATTEVPADVDSLSQVIVTAQKYAQPAYAVPVSLAVLTGDELQRVGASDLELLQYAAPGLEVQSTGAQRRIAIGGVSNYFGNGGLIAEYIDDADATSSPSLYGYSSLDIRTYDLQRVEVLRGPQGTLYGEGALGGALHFVTNKPALDEFRIGLRAEQLFTEDGAPSQHLLPVLDMPVVQGALGFRVAGEYDHDGGWIDQPTADKKNINTTDLADTRLEALWKPSDEFRVDLMHIIHRNSYVPNEGEGPGHAGLTPPGEFMQDFSLQTTPEGRDEYDLSNVTLRYTPADIAKIVSSTTYYDESNIIHNEAAAYQAAPLPAPPLDLLFLLDRYIYSEFSQEVRVSNAAVRPFAWTVGGFFKRARTNSFGTLDCIGVATAVPGSAFAPCFPFDQFIKSKQVSVFANASYDVTDKLTVGAGVRQFKDDQEFGGLSGAPVQAGTFRSTDPRFNIQYRLASYVNVYASAAKGFRSGGFNSFGQPPYAPEAIWRYEVGAKTRPILKRVRINADIYYSNYGNYQIITVLPGNVGEYTVNGGDVHIKGGEASVQWEPLNNLLISMDGEYVDGRFARTPLVATHTTGDPVDMVPRYQFGATVEKDVTILQRDWFFMVRYVQRAKEVFRDRSIGPWYYSTSDTLHMATASVGVQWNEDVRVGMEGQNLLDQREYVDPFNIENHAAKTRPLTVGFFFDAKIK